MSSTELREIEIPLSHLSVRGLEGGPADGPPIVALHGWLDNAASFIPMASHFISSYRFIVAFGGQHNHCRRLPKTLHIKSNDVF